MHLHLAGIARIIVYASFVYKTAVFIEKETIGRMVSPEDIRQVSVFIDGIIPGKFLVAGIRLHRRKRFVAMPFSLVGIQQYYADLVLLGKFAYSIGTGLV